MKRTKKRVLAIIMVLTLLMGNAVMVSAEGAGGHTFTTGAGGVLTGYSGPGGDIVIPDNVTSIGENAFKNCTEITGVTIPESVTSIGDYAFSGCTGLTSITVPDSVTTMGRYIFENCTALKTAVISTKIKILPFALFQGCKVLDNVKVADDITKIDNYAFSNCKKLNFSIPETVTEIGYGSFINNISMNPLVLPEGLTDIGTNAFKGCNGFTSLTIPGSVKSIGETTFENCKKMEELTLTDGVCGVQKGAFQDCEALTSVTIPGSIKEIPSEMFYSCGSLKEVKFEDGVEKIGDFSFQYCPLESLTVPEYVKNIGICAFANCYNLTPGAIDIADSVYMEERAFDDCDGLKDAKHYIIVNNVLFQADYDLLRGEVILPDGLVRIAGKALANCNNITKLIIPDGVTDIGERAFRLCSKMTEIVIPDSVETIGASAFEGCKGLANEKDMIIMDNTLYQVLEATEAEKVEVPVTVTAINAEAFYHCRSVKEVVLPSGLKSIGDNAFKGCEELTSITIPDSVTEIGEGVFDSCYKMESAVLPKDITEIPYKTFYYCRALKEITLPDKVVKIGESAFESCSKLSKIVMPAGVKRIEELALARTALTSFTIPDSMEFIGHWAFLSCTSLKSLTVPESVKEIEEEAFAECWNLKISGYKYSYIETYAKENNITFVIIEVPPFSYDATENPVLSVSQFEELILKNAEKDVSIKTENAEFIFEKGSMEKVSGLESYDFTTAFITDYDEANLTQSVPAGAFIAKIAYNYSGKLPGNTTIKLFMGEKHAGKGVYYSLLKEDGTLSETKLIMADGEGYISISQEHCSVYVITNTNKFSSSKGDVDGNGDITAEDALMVLKYVAHMINLSDTTTADTDGNGEVTAEDALLILKYVAHMVPSL